MEQKTILCFAAHPDDLEFSSTGTLRKLKYKNYQVIYIIVTNGENGYKIDDFTNRKKIVQIRKKEQKEAADMLGVQELIFLDYQDGFLQNTEALRKQLVVLIRRYKPEIIFSFDPSNRSFTNLNVAHRDHRVLSEAVFDACFAAKNKFMYDGEPPHRIERIYFYASDNPNHFEDISDFFEHKLKILACHKSQFPDFNKVIEFVKFKISKQTDIFEYSEPFRVLEIKPLA